MNHSMSLLEIMTLNIPNSAKCYVALFFALPYQLSLFRPLVQNFTYIGKTIACFHFFGITVPTDTLGR